MWERHVSCLPRDIAVPVLVEEGRFNARCWDFEDREETFREDFEVTVVAGWEAVRTSPVAGGGYIPPSATFLDVVPVQNAFRESRAGDITMFVARVTSLSLDGRP